MPLLRANKDWNDYVGCAETIARGDGPYETWTSVGGLET